MLKLTKKYLKGYRLAAALGLFFKLLDSVIELITPLIVASAIDDGIKAGNMAYVWRMGGVLAACYTASFGLALVCHYLAAVSAFGYGTNLRRGLYAHINSLSKSDTDRLGTPSLITRLNFDVNNTQTVINRFIRLLTRAPFLLIGALIMALRINLSMSLIFFCAAVFIAAVLFTVMKLSGLRFKAITKSQDEVARLARENLSGARVIRAFNKQQDEEKRFNARSEKLKNESVMMAAVSVLSNPLTYLIVNVSIILVLYFGSRSVYSGSLSQGEIIALINYQLQILNALVVLAVLVTVFTRGAAGAKRINEVLDTPPDSFAGGEIAPEFLAESGGPILEFKNVAMTYRGHLSPSLRDVSFSLAQGGSLGITGGIGSGKTTLISLICGLYPYEGEILISGRELREYSAKTLRGQLGVAPQKAVLFSGTLRDNMLMSVPSASDEDIMVALRAAMADFIVSPDAIVARGGGNFSGGQKQRLSIARAIIKKPRILILDDSMSALDYSTEAALRKEINAIEGLTRIIVSQRISSLKSCDLILVLDEGRPSGLGKHRELIKSCPLYAELCRIQDAG